MELYLHISYKDTSAPGGKVTNDSFWSRNESSYFKATLKVNKGIYSVFSLNKKRDEQELPKIPMISGIKKFHVQIQNTCTLFSVNTGTCYCNLYFIFGLKLLQDLKNGTVYPLQFRKKKIFSELISLEIPTVFVFDGHSSNTKPFQPVFDCNLHFRLLENPLIANKNIVFIILVRS